MAVKGPRRRYAMTDWGLMVTVFSKRYRVTMAEIARAAGYSLANLNQVCTGKNPGWEVKDAVEKFIGEYIEEHEPIYELHQYIPENGMSVEQIISRGVSGKISLEEGLSEHN